VFVCKAISVILTSSDVKVTFVSPVGESVYDSWSVTDNHFTYFM